MIDKETDIPERLKALRKRSGLSVDDLAKAAGFKHGSAIYRYETPGMFRKRFLPIELTRSFAIAMKGKGIPPITEEEVMALAGIFKDVEVQLYVSQLFTESWLKSLTDSHPKFLKMLKIKNDAMVPTLNVGDDILIDTSKEIDEDAIYVIKSEQGISVKRVQIISEKTIRLLSDNPLYKPLEKSKNEIEVIGRVVWYSHKF